MNNMKIRRTQTEKMKRDTYLLKTITQIPNDGIELFSLRFLWWFSEALMDCWWNKALLSFVVALEVHEE